MPGVMGGFSKFSAEVLKDSALNTKTKELKKSTVPWCFSIVSFLFYQNIL
jgi:hypothetical protein